MVLGVKRLLNQPGPVLGAEAGVVGIPSVGLISAGQPIAAVVYGTIAFTVCAVLGCWLQSRRDAAMAASNATPRDLVVYEAVKSGLITSADLTTYINHSQP